MTTSCTATHLGDDRVVRRPGPAHHPGTVRARPGRRGAGRRPDRRPNRRPRQVHRHAHLRQGVSRSGTSRWAWPSSCCSAPPREWPRPGLVPFASTYSVFATRRAYDFICLDIAEPGLNVNIVGGLPGLTTGYGPSHQATEDVAIFRGIPGLTIVDPCDSVDIAQAVPQLAGQRRARPICGCCAGRCPPCSTNTTTPSNWARPRCCGAAPTWCSSPAD